MPRLFSGKHIIGILCKKYGFEQIRISGSHAKLRKILNGISITTIVPLHKEVFMGTFREILRQCGISKDDFIEKSH
jgi:predicted RNA binding protein YcfA (HicA-like mRNA interferase family)